MEMPRAKRWRKAAAFSAVIHCVLFLCAGYYMTFQGSALPKEEMLEIHLTDGFSQDTGGGNEARKAFAVKEPQPQGRQDGVYEPRRAAERKPPFADAGGEAWTAGETTESENKSFNGGVSGERTETPDGAGGENKSGSGDSTSHGDAGVPVNKGAVSPPGILVKVKPPYPLAARRRGAEGTVYLRVHVMENGRAADVGVAVSSGDASLDEAAARVIYKWRFVPAKDGAGNPIACYTQIPLEFRLREF